MSTRKGDVRRREAISSKIYKQPLMADDNDDHENECDENCIFVYLPCAKHYA